MSYIYFTADLHFNHTNILKFCNRPFKNVDEMNDKLIANWNSRVKPYDTVFHVGDFCFKGGVEGGKTNFRYWESYLNGRIIHVLGNHDYRNGLRGIIKTITINISNKTAFVKHDPNITKDQLPLNCDFMLCGHVHEKWKIKTDSEIGVPIINVGCDVWNFRPVRLDELINCFQKIEKYKDG